MAASNDRGSRNTVLVTAAWFTGMGWTIAIAIAIGVFAGNWLDGQTGKHPLFVLLGLVIGLAIGLYSAGRMLIQFLNQPQTPSDQS